MKIFEKCLEICGILMPTDQNRRFVQLGIRGRCYLPKNEIQKGMLINSTLFTPTYSLVTDSFQLFNISGNFSQ